MKIPMAVASAVLLASSLGACSGGDGGEGSDYCKALEKAESEFSEVTRGNDFGQLDAAFGKMHELADKAPSDIADDWKKLEELITTLEEGLKDAGLSFSDIPKIQQGQTPEGLDPSKLQDLAAKMSTFAGPEFANASKAIEAHAKKTCKVDLNPS